MLQNRAHFKKLLESKNPVGEVVAVNKFMVRVRGLQPCNVHSLVLFEDGSKGFVSEVDGNSTKVMHMGKKELKVGTVAVIQHDQLLTKVGEDFIGRIISVNTEPLDGKGPIVADSAWAIFNKATNIDSRELLSEQLETGIMVVDSVFPIVKGQRMALLGDAKSGKSTFASQIAINQQKTDQIVVYCLIAKRKIDVDAIINRLSENGGIDNTIVVVSTIFDSLVLNYLAPYVACSMAEYLWLKKDRDVIVVYDDLTSHAHAYREISLLSGSSPGRDSYPGDMFYAHSRLLERAGRLNSSKKSLTSIPVAHVANGDITAYLPTNIMSITDGQWILDMDTFRNGFRPALNLGLSVTRAGGLGHNERQKKIAVDVLRLLADYREAKEFSHFGSELSDLSRKALFLGDLILSSFNQPPSISYSLIEQQLILSLIMSLSLGDHLDIEELKNGIKESANKYRIASDFDKILTELKNKYVSYHAAPKSNPTVQEVKT